MAAQRYNVQCINHGYAGTVGPEDPDLYAKCQQHEAARYIDAFCLGPDNDFCGVCTEKRRKRQAADRCYLYEIQDPESLWYIEDEGERAAHTQYA